MSHRFRPLFALLACLLGLAFTSTALAGDKPNLKFKGCSKTDETKITDAWQWVIDNVDKIQSKMGKNGLKSMSDKVKKRYKKKLLKKTKVRCMNEKKACKKVWGWALPIAHQKRISLCTQYFAKDTLRDYSVTIAHEVAHLARINGHRTKCEKMYTKPRFSQSIDLAVHALYGPRSVKELQDYYLTTCKKKGK